MTNKKLEKLDNMDNEKMDKLFGFAEYNAEKAESMSYSNYSYWRSTVRTFSRNKVGMFMFIVIVVFTLFAIIQPFLPNQLDPTAVTLDPRSWRNAPSEYHPFGTDQIGRDVWSRVWSGTRLSLRLAVTVGIMEITIGVIMGAIWGYVKALDRIMTEIHNVIANVPNLVLYTLLAFLLRPGFWTIVFVMVVTGWIGMARFVRNMVMIIRDREYNLASRTLGTPLPRMLLKNIIPFLVSVIIMRLAIAIPSVINAEVGLSFLGIGLPVTYPTLGNQITTGLPLLSSAPHLMLYPAAALTVITISTYVVGNAFSDASDPRNHT